MPRGLRAHGRIRLAHGRCDMGIPHRRANQATGEGRIEPAVGHHSAHQQTVDPSAHEPEDVVAVENPMLGTDQCHAIRVAVQADAQVGAGGAYVGCRGRWRSSHSVVDVVPVGCAAPGESWWPRGLRGRPARSQSRRRVPRRPGWSVR